MSPHIPFMPHHDPNPYRWQDHVVTPRRAAASLIATVLVILVVGAAAATRADPPRPPAVHAVATEHTPPRSQLAKQPTLPRATRGPL